MLSKTGRNELCSCGSGKKYKHCCLTTASSSLTQGWRQTSDAAWYKVRKTEGQLTERLVDFMMQHISKQEMEIAMEDFIVLDEEIQDESCQAALFDAFLSWFLYNWPIEYKKQRTTIAKWYASEHTLTPYEKDLLRVIEQHPYSFFQIIETQPGVSLHIQDLLTREILIVNESSLSQTGQPGQIVLARPVPFDDRIIFVGILPFPLSHLFIEDILDFRDWAETEMGKPLTQTALEELEYEIFTLYEDCIERREQVAPQLRNTDNEELVPMTVIFDLQTTPQIAFDALCSLSTIQSREELLKEEAVYDKKRQLKHITFSWTKQGNPLHPEWDNTVLGTLIIDKKKLTVDCNSVERADRIRAIVLERLGDAVKFKRSRPTKPVVRTQKEREEMEREQAEFLENPEIQAQLAAMQAAHWAAWPKMKLPILNGMMPLEAAGDSRGRELLESLLLDIEQKNAHLGSGVLPVNTHQLRETLGMLKLTTVKH